MAKNKTKSNEVDNETEEKNVSTKKISARDFCDSKKGLKHKDRICYVLNHKYPNSKKTISEWDEILISEEII